jgi:hypothetical protein
MAAPARGSGRKLATTSQERRGAAAGDGDAGEKRSGSGAHTRITKQVFFLFFFKLSPVQSPWLLNYQYSSIQWTSKEQAHTFFKRKVYTMVGCD